NGANTSFVNQIGDQDLSVDTLIEDPVQKARAVQPLRAPHDRIPLPRDLYRSHEDRANSAGLDLSNEHRLGSLAAALLNGATQAWRAAPTGLDWQEDRASAVLNPADRRDVVGQVIEADETDVQ